MPEAGCFDTASSWTAGQRGRDCSKSHRLKFCSTSNTKKSGTNGTRFQQMLQMQRRSVADQLRGKFPKLGALMDEAEDDVLAFMTFPRAHWQQIHSTNPLERLNAEIKRRTKVVGIFPNDASIVRLVGAMMLEQNDEWSLNRRYMQLDLAPENRIPC